MLAQIAELELLNIIETHKATKMEGLRRVLVMLQHQDPAAALACIERWAVAVLRQRLQRAALHGVLHRHLKVIHTNLSYRHCGALINRFVPLHSSYAQWLISG
jgi:hypothetical protein